MRYGLSLLAFVSSTLLAAAGLIGCAQGGDGLLPDPRDAGGGSMGAMDGAAPADGGACGMDCGSLDTPPCMVSVCNDGSLPGPIGECVTQPLPNGAPCDDGDRCTLGDTCTAGVCMGAPNDCSDVSAGECQETYCDPETGACMVRADAARNGTPCTSGDRCLSGTTCADGVCEGTPTDCSHLPAPNECQAAICNPATGGCVLSSANEGGPCTSTDACAVGSVCTDGACTGGTAPACSSTRDGCCPSGCTAANDPDCACPGEVIGDTCVYLPSTVSAPTHADARAQCTALGAGWDLCSPSSLCQATVTRYLATRGCACGGGAATCACGSSANIYVHVNGASPHYVRGPDFPDCIASAACTDSVSESCGVALCCRPR